MKYYISDYLYEDYPNAVNINWMITSRCLYNCSYCIGAKDNLKENTYDEISYAIKNLKQTYGDIFYQVCLTGGEPSLKTYLEDMINLCDETFINNRIVYLTNLFLSEKNLKKRYDKINNTKKIISVCSLHLEAVKDIPTYLSKIKFLMNTYTFYSFEFKIVVPSYLQNVAQNAVDLIETQYPELLSYLRIVRNFKETFQLPKSVLPYVAKDQIFIYKNFEKQITQKCSFNDLKDAGLNKTRNMKCLLCKHFLNITTQGNIYSGIPHECKNVKLLGNIKDMSTYDIIKKEKEIIQICNQDICPLECTMVVPKYRDNEK